MKFFGQLKELIITSIFMFFAFTAFSQDEQPNDPLNKPAIWEQVAAAPNQQSLWVQYFEKPWISLTVVEKERISLWRKQLNRKNYEQEIRQTAQNSEKLWNNMMSDTENNEEIRTKIEVEKAQFHKMLTNHVMPENELIADLKKNVEANFILLEDIYKVEFAELGATYTEYATEHPNGKYSKILWIEHQTRKLNQLKSDYLAELKSNSAQ